MDPRLAPAVRVGALRPREAAAPAPVPAAATGAFATALAGAGVFRFSAHAEGRLARRGVSFDASQLRRLGAGIDAAARKGSREALVLVDDVAMVVAVGNRTVVTALAPEGGDPAVFTNIDAAVIS